MELPNSSGLWDNVFRWRWNGDDGCPGFSRLTLNGITLVIFHGCESATTHIGSSAGRL